MASSDDYQIVLVFGDDETRLQLSSETYALIPRTWEVLEARCEC